MRARHHHLLEARLFGPLTRDLLETMEAIREGGARFQSLADTTTYAGKLIMTVFAGMAEFERDLIRERAPSPICSVGCAQPPTQAHGLILVAQNALLQAGVATEDISPEIGCVLAAYHRAERSKGILDLLELGALVLRSNSSMFVWITVDNVVFLLYQREG